MGSFPHSRETECPRVRSAASPDTRAKPVRGVSSGLLDQMLPGRRLIPRHIYIEKGTVLADGALAHFDWARVYLILVSLNSTCFLTTGSYFLKVNLSVLVREFFF